MGPPKKRAGEAEKVEEKAMADTAGKKRKKGEEAEADGKTKGDAEEAEAEHDEALVKKKDDKAKKRKIGKEEDEGSDDKDAELQRTVFVRNVPLEATEQELKALMYRWAETARVCM